MSGVRRRGHPPSGGLGRLRDRSKDRSGCWTDRAASPTTPTIEEITMPLSTFLRTRPVVVGLAGLGLVGTLAGCSAASDATTAATTPATSSDASTPSASASASSGSSSTSSSTYKDGTYSADGTYQAPSGTETITVTLTIVSDDVTKVTIGTHATDPNAKQYQTMFANGISSQVVGKALSDLSVTRVAGSSLTSNGFKAAVAKIETQAAS
jgi:uncharacterized protein with FMN-binding domain